MDDKFTLDLDDGYQSTKTYKEASPAMRRQMNRYKKENDISDEHMFLLLFEKDLDSVPDSARKDGEVASNAMVIIGFLLLWSSLQSAMNASGGANVPLIFLSVGSFVLVAIVYYMGLLSPYKRAVRNLNKRLSKMPAVPDFDEWNQQNPGPSSAKSKRSKKRR